MSLASQGYRPPAKAGKRSPETEMTKLEPVKILVVDDEAAIRNLLHDLLGDEGYVVSTASNGRSALAMVRQERPDLILMDVMMPELDGLETLRHLRGGADSASIPVILMSAAAYLTPDSADGTAFIAKPFNLDHVLAVVAQMLPAKE